MRSGLRSQPEPSGRHPGCAGQRFRLRRTKRGARSACVVRLISSRERKEMTHTDQSNSEVLARFSELVGKSLHIDPSLVTPDTYLDDLGAESLDLIEITMETESQFDVWLPEKSILDIASEIFGPGVLEKDGLLTEQGKRLMQRRMPPEDAADFEGEIAVKDLRHYFMKVGTWIRMIESLLEHTPRACSACGGPVQ